MSELFQYGISSSSDKKCVTPTETIPPLFQFKDTLDCLFTKINVVLNQEPNSLFYDRSLGSSIPEYVFEDDSTNTEDALKNAIYTSLTSSIDDINITDIQVERKETLNGIEYNVEIIISFNQTSYTLKFLITQSGITVVQEG